MGLLFKKYKTRFRYALKPVFAMLVSKEKEMGASEWSAYVSKTHINILNNALEFLGTDLPDVDLMKDILDELFKEFSTDLKIKKTGSFNK
jgi:hypothetical protein